MNTSERKYKIFHAFFASFYSRRFYQEVAHLWKGTGLAFLVLWAFIQAAIIFVQVVFATTTWFHEKFPAFVEKIPIIRIEKGILSTDTGKPFVLLNDKETSPALIIDPTQSGIPDDLPDSVMIYASSNRLQIRKNSYDTRLIDFSKGENLNLTIDHPFLQKAAWVIAGVICFMAPSIMLTVSAITNIIRALFYSLFAKAFNRFRKLSFDYTTLLRLTAYALNPMIACKTILTSMRVNFPFSWLFYFLIACGFVAFALISQNAPEKDESA